MKKLYKNQKVSTWKIQKQLGLNNTRLYRYINGVTPIDSMPLKLVIDIAHYLHEEPNDLFEKMKKYLG